MSNWGQIGRLQVAATIAKSTCVDYTPKLKCTLKRGAARVPAAPRHVSGAQQTSACAETKSQARGALRRRATVSRPKLRRAAAKTTRAISEPRALKSARPTAVGAWCEIW